MSVKSNYFKMNREEFDAYLKSVKSSENTIHLLHDRYFYLPTQESVALVISLNKKMTELDTLIHSFTEFSQKQILQSFLIDEIESTNEIESIYSTRYDIFSVIRDGASSKDRKIISIANAYKRLLTYGGTEIKELSEIRNLYDIVLKNAIDKKDNPDGLHFRKDNVYVSDGFKSVHAGVIGEDKVNEAMKEFLCLYNSENEIFTKLILSHFLFENIHPFYDGNGRLGRFLFSNELYRMTGSYLSFVISWAFAEKKDTYYKAFKMADDKYEFGCLNDYFGVIASILCTEADILMKRLEAARAKLDSFDESLKLTKSETKIYRLISEASLFSDFGISNEEILSYTGVSKRTLMYALDKFRMNQIITDTAIGKFTFHKSATERPSDEDFSEEA